MLRYKTKLDLL